MEFESPLIPALFRERPNRFLGIVEIGSQRVQCFIPNPGRMNELLYPGAKVHLLRKESKARKTDYDLVLVDHDGILVSIDSRVPNKVVSESINEGKIPEFRNLSLNRVEYIYLDSRLDILLKGDEAQLLLEVKSCTLVEETIALFPDAPTKRGRRHLRTLQRGLAEGRAAILFLIQRGDAHSFKPNVSTDPDFDATLREVANLGVEAYAYSSKVTEKGVYMSRRVPIIL
jgi:sugar fermentation stimulation protein A